MIDNRMKGLAAGVALIMSLGAFGNAGAAQFEGFGQDIPLESAARQIVPADQKVDYADGVDAKTPITFSSSADWQSSLSSAVAKKGLKATFTTDGVRIAKDTSPKPRPYSSSPSRNTANKNHTQRRNAPAAAPQSLGPRVVADAPAQEVASAAAGQPQASVQTQGGGGFSIRQATPAPAPAPVPVAANVPTTAPATGHGLSGKDFSPKGDWKNYGGTVGSGKFIVVTGYDLRATLESWAAATGWTINWKSEFSYSIEADATFTGDFVKAATDLRNAMADARPTINLDFYQANKVLVVSNLLADEVN
ncbi:toxin co-regulated pilus biosynthesis Q family protein [Rhizobium leguminosarum]|uniref:toxin co-regulated pilus biosynthesis Q family protein n=1 Tax=Rhizobium leguminosarum TaxID=384 RepID=UPI002E12805E|nr:toxin co-regulated pilus biosynthesis Q family protein [Rhizobium leguminosarum]